MTATESDHHRLGMTDNEYASVIEILGRKPRPAELAMYSVMWSEHCSYKSSRAHLGRLPTEAPWVIIGPGENAGVVDLGDGWLAALRIESHNHPSFIEPYEGAATGVGGILRDIFTMGARPIAIWDLLRFGPLDDPRNRYLFGGVVGGIGGYGNSVGVPTLGGEVEFADSYSSNPLVNVMALGIMRQDQLVLSGASGEGNVAVLLGASTGRDGIGGASVLASAGFDEASGTKRPSVQIGDPFEEKKLIEVCLDLYKRGLVVGIQDLGAAGLSGATSESATNGKMGMEVDLDLVPLRESTMTAAEILMSESQERMLAIVKPDDLDDVIASGAKWGVGAKAIGIVIKGNILRIQHRGELVAELPATSLTTDAPQYRRDAARPGWLDSVWDNTVDLPDLVDAGEVLLHILDDPALGDKSWIYEQYDHMLFLNTIVPPGHDAALIRIKGTEKGLAVSTDGNGPLCYLDPQIGSARIVYEAALNVAVAGARPYALVDNLNFGNPEKPEVMWQFMESVEGIARACETLGVPVIGGNVSFYNETDGVDIYPTPVCGMLGFCDPIPVTPPRLDRATNGMEVWLVGSGVTAADDISRDFCASAFSRVELKHLGGRPIPPNHDRAAYFIDTAVRLAHEAPVLHDISAGGLAVALAEISIASGVGMEIEVSSWQDLFAEPALTFVMAAAPNSVDFEETDARWIGTIGGDRIDFGAHGSAALTDAARTWRNALPRRLG